MKHKYKQCWVSGLETENRFSDLAARSGFQLIRRASSFEQMREKWDQEWLIGNSYERIEIKSKKKDSRHSKSLSDRIVIELRGIKNSIGWLYGSATMFAFENDNGFILVRQSDLVNLVNKNIIGLNNPFLKMPSNIVENWRAYHRVSQPDELCVYVDTKEIEEISLMKLL